ncbi:hypothetical protein [Streptomyces mayonensis]|uniref:hypothetical protein n=1 Tax=Streptomyces mayonensis TaxID=2750816 RepID=UPI001C1E8C87|nr:hypothetical protein [Streptomyces sp. A108]MBU6529700.1 hypothetical protein [Streptomyces sp. A108]
MADYAWITLTRHVYLGVTASVSGDDHEVAHGLLLEAGFSTEHPEYEYALGDAEPDVVQPTLDQLHTDVVGHHVVIDDVDLGRRPPIAATAHPHITVGHHARYGVIASTSHDNPVAEHMLGRVGFKRLTGSNMYTLTEPHREPVRRGSQAVQSLRAAQYSVTSDAAYDLQPVTRQTPASNMPLDASPDIGDHVQLNPNRVLRHRRAHAATDVSPARSSATSHRPALAAEQRSAPAPALRARAR